MSMAQIRAINSFTIRVENYTSNLCPNVQKTHNDNQQTYLLFSSTKDCDHAIEICENNALKVLRMNEINAKDFTISAINIPSLFEQELKEHFKIFGDVGYLRIIRDDDKESKGYCYVTFKDEQAYKKALTAKTLPINDNIVHLWDKLPIEQLESKQTIYRKIIVSKEKRKQRHHKIADPEKLNNIGSVECNQELQLKNEMRTAGRILRKKIKKINTEVNGDQFELVKRMKQFKGAIQRKQDEFFRLPSQLKARRDQRKIKMEFNKKKANKLHK